MVIRLAVANLEPAELADALAAEGLSGTVLPAVGFTPEWGREPSAVAILAGASIETVQAAARKILADAGEDAAYMDNGADAWLVWQDRSESISA